MGKRVLLIAATTGYQVREFSDAAKDIGVELVFATDRCHVLENPWGDAAVPVRFEDPAAGIESLVGFGPFDGIVAVGDGPSLIAAQIAERFGLPFSSPDAVRASKNKFLARGRFRDAGLPVPNYWLVPIDSHLEEAAVLTRYPCVLKPLELSASRGVIRANDAVEFVAAFERIRKIAPRTDSLLVEDFIPGREFALEGLVTRGRLQTLALFDKPDPLDGPFFEETIYSTPSREPADVQEAILAAAERAVTALGLTQGPVHAEMRVDDSNVWMLEVAARPIGGLCSRVLRFDQKKSLEEVILRHALGEDVFDIRLSAGAHGVMMIPIPCAGTYTGVSGIEQARAVPGIEAIVITAKTGQTMLPLPEGASYLGFIFARSHLEGNQRYPKQPEVIVQDALRVAHSTLKFHLSSVLPVVR